MKTHPPSRQRSRDTSDPAYSCARDQFAERGVDVEVALRALAGIAVSVHCWQGDDVCGFENARGPIGGGLAVTGNHPERATNAEELRADLDQALALIPGNHRINLHAMYGDFGNRPVDRDEVAPEHFRTWIAWAAERRLGLDFNPTCFAHPRAADGFTLSHPDAAVRQFWITHCRRSRAIAAAMGRALHTPCISNVWIPDGFKDTPADRQGPRERLAESLDAVFQKRYPGDHLRDAVEPKLFGIGAESCTVGSAEFYFGYALTRRKMLCLDSGHFHPTESIADKISSVLQFLPEILLHVSRGVRWDSDHVITFGDELLAMTREVVANGLLGRVHFGLDYFDASINRIAAWVIGARNLLRALLIALLEPPGIREAEIAGDRTARLALQEESRLLPVGAVWNEHCKRLDVPIGEAWLSDVRRYEIQTRVQRA